jgi:hypothetical protein
MSESEWMRTYKIGDAFLHESKFLVDGLTVRVEEIEARWPTFSTEERLEFALAFSAKPGLTPEDVRVLDFLLEAGERYVWSTVAALLPRHPDKERALGFLLKMIGNEERYDANFFHALERINDKRAIPAIKTAYDTYRRKLDGLADRRSACDAVGYMSCCKALWALEGSANYKDAIEEFLKSDDKAVCRFAEIMLFGERPR